MGRTPIGIDPHWPPRDGDPEDVVTIVVTGKPDAISGKRNFWIKWHAGRREDDKLASAHGWRAQHFHGDLRYQQAYWGMTRMRVVTVDLSGP